MGIVTGKIKEIEDLSQGVHLKKRVSIKTNESGYVFLEFRGVLKKLCDNLKEGDDVMAEHSYDGKTSKKSGVKFNNLPGINIQKIN
ncbi:hypothetical protein [Lutibacter maritimus]|uniref:Uncharacterized protein n=1 Tax=Lutibacter maritimus TaxID=593133 RepID=A0A1I6NRG6_9FLAO|nr:hypothetical protein [Lutibacter maritimus]SFS30493.1 hypothetical protein SAMN04488006_0444 [Lutibacter maritimus]